MDPQDDPHQQHKKHKKLRKNIQKKRKLKKEAKDKRKQRKAEVEQNSKALKKIHFHIESIQRQKEKSKLFILQDT